MNKTLKLFGADLEFSPTGTLDVSELSANGNTYNCRVTGTLDTAAQTVKLNIDGDLPGGSLKMEQTFGYEAFGSSQIVLTEVKEIHHGLLTLGLGTDKSASVSIVTTEAPIGLLIEDAPQLTFYLVNNAQVGGLENFKILSDDWTSTEIAFDIASDSYSAVPCGAAIVVSDRFDLLDYDTLGKSQYLDIRSFTVTNGILTTIAHSRTGAFLLHPDILDTRGDYDSNTYNALLYQYALVNGQLNWRLDLNNTAHNEVRWQSRRQGPAPGMVMFRYRDEHGNPLVLVPDDKEIGFRIGFRSGVLGSILESNSSYDWDSTNRAACIILDRNENNDRIPLEGKLIGMDPVTLYGRPRSAEGDYNDDPFDYPYWLTGKTVIYAKKPTVEIHGILRGVQFRRSDTDLAAHWRNSDWRGYTATLHVVPVTTKNSSQEIFHQSELRFPDADAWEMEILAEERSIYIGIGGDKPDQKIERYRSTAISGKELRLPLIETSYALANMVGVKRTNLSNEQLGTGFLVKKAGEWLEGLEQQFTGNVVYADPSLKKNTHTNGRTLEPPNRQPLETIITRPAATALSIAKTATSGAEFLANKPIWAQQEPFTVEDVSDIEYYSHFTYGGSRDDGSQRRLRSDRDVTAKIVEFLQEKFLKAIMLPDSLPDDIEQYRVELVALRKFLVKEKPVFNLNDDDDMALIESLVSKAYELIYNRVYIPGIDKSDYEFLESFLEQLSAEGFLEFWQDDIEDNFLKPLVQFLHAPADSQLFRRGLWTLYPELADPKAPLATTVEAYKKLLTTSLHDKAERLFQLRNQWINLDTIQLTALRAVLGGMPLSLALGIDALMPLAREIWKAYQSEVMESLRQEFGPYLTDDVYQDLMDRAVEARAFLETLKEYSELFTSLKDLADLQTVIPDYLFVTKRFQTLGSANLEKVKKLWSQKFDLCHLGESIKWNFFLDTEASIIVKLTSDRTLADILTTIEKEYQTEARPNPLGLPELPASPDDPIQHKTLLEQFTTRLHPTLRDKNWTGVLIISPTADISQDIVLRDLAGLEYIKAAYVAVGGDKPLKENGANLDVTASIFKEEPQPKQDEANRENLVRGDMDFALTKFDVTIHNTQIEDGEIVFRLDLQTLWGRNWREVPYGSSPSLSDSAPKPKSLFIRGALPKKEKHDDDAGAPPAFEFAAWFAPPLVIDIDVAFIKSVTLQSIRVGRHKGRTSLDVDGKLDFQKWEELDDIGISIFKGSDNPNDALESLILSELRILLPSLAPGELIDFGVFRDLDFDFPSVRFSLPNPRAISLWGIDLLPQKIGFVRKPTGESYENLKSRFTWFGDRFPKPGNDFNIPFIEFAVDFGNLPEFGRTNLKGLRFNLCVALSWKKNRPEGVSLGISGIEARDIEIDLFRLLSLRMKSFALKKYRVKAPSGTGNIEVGGILAEDIKLKILDWQPLPEASSLNLLMLQGDPKLLPNAQNKAGLAFYSHEDLDSMADDFVRIYWLILAHNLALDKKVLNHLMFEGGGQDPEGLLDLIIPKAPGNDPKRKRGDTINARILEKESWLFGASFGLGDILDTCSFVLHDQHYYGIKLSADWLEAAIGQDTLELAYMPGPTPRQDRYRTNLILPFLNWLGLIRSGEFALEWSPSWDFLIDVGFPWKTRNGHNWFRAFAAGTGVECKLGFYIDKRTQVIPSGQKSLTLAAGMGYYAGYYWGGGNRVAWVRAGIGVFAILEGTITLVNSKSANPLKGSIQKLEVVGVVGIFAYGEGGIDVWILSARFRVAATAALEGWVIIINGGPTSLTYTAYLHVYYSASVRVGKGPFKWTFRVSGRLGKSVNGRLLLN